MPAVNFVNNVLEFKWLRQLIWPVFAFVSAANYETRTPHRFIHTAVGCYE